MSDKVTAGDIACALRRRHRDDVTSVEHATRHGSMRLDFWALARSWAKYKTTGYEIKVTRRDFVQDEKWLSYRPYVHELYMACAWGIVQPEEMPEGVGLLWMNKGHTLTVKRKAARQEPEPEKLIELLTRQCWGPYQGAQQLSREERYSEMKRKYEKDKDMADFGRNLEWRIANLTRTAAAEMRKAQDQQEKLKGLLDWAKSQGLDPLRSYQPMTSIQASLEKAIGGLSPAVVRELEVKQRAIESLLQGEGRS